MLSTEENDLLTRVGPGTPAGEMLRPYWWPIGFSELFEENGERVIGAGTEYCNWLQRAENSVDQTHLVALHAPEYPHMALKRPEIGWQKTAYGAKITMHVPGVSKPKHSHWVFPSHTRHTTARKGRIPDHAIRFRVPTDDTKTTTFWLRFTPNDEANRGEPLVLKTVGFEDDKPGIYTRVEDGWLGIASHDQDRVAQESQGDIYDRSKEHLGASDQGVILLRNTIKESIDAVRQGKDPFWILRRPELNEKITFDASMAEIGALG